MRILTRSFPRLLLQGGNDNGNGIESECTGWIDGERCLGAPSCNPAVAPEHTGFGKGAAEEDELGIEAVGPAATGRRTRGGSYKHPYNDEFADEDELDAGIAEAEAEDSDPIGRGDESDDSDYRGEGKKRKGAAAAAAARPQRSGKKSAPSRRTGDPEVRPAPPDATIPSPPSPSTPAITRAPALCLGSRAVGRGRSWPPPPLP